MRPKQSVGNCHSALRRGIHYANMEKTDSLQWIPRRSAE